MKSEAEIIQALELIKRDSIVSLADNDYLPIGEIVHKAAEHIKFLRKQVEELEAWRYGY